MNMPRPEHPKPQFQRDSWINLNGEWTYDFPVPYAAASGTYRLLCRELAGGKTGEVRWQSAR